MNSLDMTAKSATNTLFSCGFCTNDALKNILSNQKSVLYKRLVSLKIHGPLNPHELVALLMMREYSERNIQFLESSSVGCRAQKCFEKLDGNY